MRSFLAVLTALTVVTVASSCSLFSDNGSVRGGGYLQTDAIRYEARLETGAYDRVVFDVPFETHNPTSDSLYLVGCGHPTPPSLEKRVNGRWETVYSPIVLLCLGQPWSIAPGAARPDTLRVIGALPGQNAGPTFDAEINGTYRLRTTIYRDVASSGDPRTDDTLPLRKSVSNTFEVRKVE